MTSAKPFVPPKPGLSSLVRPQFSPGLLLEDDDLNAAVKYTRDLMRLMLRSMFGCGVVCGLDVTTKLTCGGSKLEVSVAPGVAVDCAGNMIEVESTWTQEFDSDCRDFPAAMWVVICYDEKCCRPKDVTCSDDDSQTQHTRVRAGFNIYLYGAIPDCACRCATTDDHAAGGSTSTTHGCCHGYVAPAPAGAAPPVPPEECPCYIDHYKGKCGGDCGCTCVLLGKIDPKTPGSTTNVEGVRRVRPVLNGFQLCRDAHRAAPPPPAPASPPFAPMPQPGLPAAVPATQPEPALSPEAQAPGADGGPIS
jgi:hypothetical protein